uniref:Integrase, catalytic region, zinc finger, CCHC-type, peptidase aspartic, catalytic n=1 Tax=Tanacetum cinerariifolium TaxID=118510 RepID=A0A6L2LHR0_TANCI|nr:hypothetical protein [Tanacetum cinerariifolium]
MANLSKDIQCVGSDTQPPMLDRTDFASCQQCIRLYFRRKENEVNILKSIDEGPFQMGTFKETIVEGEEGALHLGPERARAHANENKMMLERFTQHTVDPLALMSNVSPQRYSSQSSTTPPSTHVSPVNYQPYFTDNTQLDSGLSPTNNLIENLTNTLALLTQYTKLTFLKLTINSEFHQIQGTKPQSKTTGLLFRMFRVDRIEVRGTMQGEQVQLVIKELIIELGMLIRVKKCRLSVTTAMENGVVLDEEQLLFIAGGQDNGVDKDVDELPVHDLSLNVDNVFQAYEFDSFDSDVDEAPTAQTMFMANLSSTYLVYDEAGLSNDSDILSKVYDHDNYQDVFYEHHEVNEMHDDVQPNCIVNSDAKYTCDSNMIPYDQYVKDNAEPVVQNNLSSVPNDASMMIITKMHEQTAQCVSMKAHTKVVDASLTARLVTYNEQVELYERWAKFKIIEREQKIEEQLRIVITGRNIKEEN